jgi:pimeloyl-ACP methyl ester carboxylesterase
VDTYARPSAFAASIGWYRAGAATVETARRAAAHPQPDPPPLPQPAEVLWGERDPLFPPEWAAGLDRCLHTYQLAVLPGVGHFIPFEAAAAVAEAVSRLLAG